MIPKFPFDADLLRYLSTWRDSNGGISGAVTGVGRRYFGEGPDWSFLLPSPQDRLSWPCSLFEYLPVHTALVGREWELELPRLGFPASSLVSREHLSDNLSSLPLDPLPQLPAGVPFPDLLPVGAVTHFPSPVVPVLGGRYGIGGGGLQIQTMAGRVRGCHQGPVSHRRGRGWSL